MTGMVCVMMSFGQVIGTQHRALNFVPVGISCIVCGLLGFHGQFWC